MATFEINKPKLVNWKGTGKIYRVSYREENGKWKSIYARKKSDAKEKYEIKKSQLSNGFGSNSKKSFNEVGQAAIDNKSKMVNKRTECDPKVYKIINAILICILKSFSKIEEWGQLQRLT